MVHSRINELPQKSNDLPGRRRAYPPGFPFHFPSGPVLHPSVIRPCLRLFSTATRSSFRVNLEQISIRTRDHGEFGSLRSIIRKKKKKNRRFASIHERKKNYKVFESDGYVDRIAMRERGPFQNERDSNVPLRNVCTVELIVNEIERIWQVQGYIYILRED